MFAFLINFSPVVVGACMHGYITSAITLAMPKQEVMAHSVVHGEDIDAGGSITSNLRSPLCQI